MRNVAGIVVSYVFIFLIIIAAKFFEKSGKEASRKFIHIMLCNWWFIAMYFFDGPIWASFVPLTFIIINWISYKKDIIDVMERDEKEKDGLGTVYYAISLMLLTICTFGIIKMPEVGLVGILVMGYGDGLAAIMGQTIKSKSYQIGKTTKTLAGSLTMLIISFIIISVFLVFKNIPDWHIKSLLVSIIITIVEAIGIKGTDNFTVPLVTSALVYLLVM